jgi:co-chaperonin GroES (HSP10)
MALNPSLNAGIQAKDDVVFILRDDPEKVSAGGIYLGGTEPQLSGIVVAAGPGKLIKRSTGEWVRRPMGVAVGERVLFSKHGHQTQKVNGIEYVVLREDSIAATLDPDCDITEGEDAPA